MATGGRARPGPGGICLRSQGLCRASAVTAAERLTHLSQRTRRAAGVLSPAARLTREEPGPNWESPRQCKEQSCISKPSLGAEAATAAARWQQPGLVKLTLEPCGAVCIQSERDGKYEWKRKVPNPKGSRRLPADLLSGRSEGQRTIQPGSRGPTAAGCSLSLPRVLALSRALPGNGAQSSPSPTWPLSRLTRRPYTGVLGHRPYATPI